MISLFFSDPAAWQRLHVGPLSPYIEGFAQHLLKQRYAPYSVIGKLRVMAKLSRWLERQQLVVEQLAEPQAARFLHELHRRERRPYQGDRRTLAMLLEQLRCHGILTAPATTPDTSERTQLEREFAGYLRTERGLSAATLRIYLPFVQRFLSVRFGQSPLVLQQLCARDVTRFVLEQTPGLGTRARLMVTALRSFFRFLRQRGDLDTDLAGAVPTVAHRHLSTLPEYLMRIRWSACSGAAIQTPGSASATTPFYCCSRVWGCEPAKSSTSAWRISIGMRGC